MSNHIERGDKVVLTPLGWEDLRKRRNGAVTSLRYFLAHGQCLVVEGLSDTRFLLALDKKLNGYQDVGGIHMPTSINHPIKGFDQQLHTTKACLCFDLDSRPLTDYVQLAAGRV